MAPRVDRIEVAVSPDKIATIVELLREPRYQIVYGEDRDSVLIVTEGTEQTRAQLLQTLRTADIEIVCDPVLLDVENTPMPRYA